MNEIPQAKLCIWMRGGLRPHLGIGHAALKITTYAAARYYITWLAGDDAILGLYTTAADSLGFADTPYALGGGNRPAHSYKADKRGVGPRFDNRPARTVLEKVTARNGETGQFQEYPAIPATFKVSIPCKNEHNDFHADGFFGLDVEAIEEWWRTLLAHTPPGSANRRYLVLSTTRNCCAIVRRALQAGGLDAYAKPPSPLIAQDAATLLNWVRDSVRRIDGLNDLKEVMLGILPELPPVAATIPGLNDWKTDSDRYVRFSMFARRKEQVAALDRLIVQYHRADNDTARRQLLYEMFRYAGSHLLSKPKSDRRRAVMALTTRILATIKDLQNASSANVSQLAHLAGLFC